LLVVLLPVFIGVALAIAVDTRGTIFYRCRRVGYRGRPLSMLKFRKMRRDAAGPPLTVAHDPRLTRVGAFLARTKLDELPQLWHVVKGEMSLVGPRPEDERFVMLQAEAYAEILRVRPGITGLSQLAFAEESRILAAGDPASDYLIRVLPQKLGLDRLYAAERSFAMDARILWWTVAAVVLRRRVAVDRRSGRLSTRRRREPAAVVEPTAAKALPVPGGEG
jgi:lipopolysaccharide/colanic/teichoic acid biosynthesis glycosyltransferase